MNKRGGGRGGGELVMDGVRGSSNGTRSSSRISSSGVGQFGRSADVLHETTAKKWLHFGLGADFLYETTGKKWLHSQYMCT